MKLIARTRGLIHRIKRNNEHPFKKKEIKFHHRLNFRDQNIQILLLCKKKKGS